MSVSSKSSKSPVPSISGSISGKMEVQPDSESLLKKKGLGMGMTAFFLVAQMAGAGFLSLPKAVANTGWLGLAMMLLFCVMIGFSGTRLGHCWIIMEERWPEYKLGHRQPYMEIAYRALGLYARRLSLVCVLAVIIGGTLAYIILVGGFMHDLVPSLSLCEWILITCGALLPFTWLGTPKDFWQASILAVVATSVACLVLIVEIIVEKSEYPDPFYPNPSVTTLALGFGAILFAYGGASVFPTIQNDMADRSLFPKSVVFAFIGLILMYFPVAASGYIVQGADVGDNILLSIDTSKGIVKAAIVLQVINLLGTYLITFNPIAQTFEELFKVENKFGLPRIILRSAVILFEMTLALAMPDFGAIVNLVGGSTVTICTFVLPPLMYMKLVDNNSDPSWPVRTIPLWERILLWEIICTGVVGGVSSTASAIIGIIDSSFGTSCFVSFS